MGRRRRRRGSAWGAAGERSHQQPRHRASQRRRTKASTRLEEDRPALHVRHADLRAALEGLPGPGELPGELLAAPQDFVLRGAVPPSVRRERSQCAARSQTESAGARPKEHACTACRCRVFKAAPPQGRRRSPRGGLHEHRILAICVRLRACTQDQNTWRISIHDETRVFSRPRCEAARLAQVLCFLTSLSALSRTYAPGSVWEASATMNTPF